MAAKLLVSNVSYDTTSDELRDLFSEAGQVESCVLLTDPDTGQSSGIAFIKMNSAAAAEAAIAKFNGQELRGRTLMVKDGGRMGSGNLNSSRRS
ncbi:MAG TPA: RNA-binding protein [Blastocatellia bacterium]|jgi:RNA recognition motif-containing protein|nr:RNA-binding protein [Blastocatellia bacterium]